MLDAIKKFFEDNLRASQPADEEHQLKLATAALLVEMMAQDGEHHHAEHAQIKHSLQTEFDLSEDEAHELIELARQESHDATDYHQFTSLIARNYTQSQKIKVIEYLWAVAFADGKLDKYEEHMVRRIADLIHVAHKDFMQARHKFE